MAPCSIRNRRLSPGASVTLSGIGAPQTSGSTGISPSGASASTLGVEVFNAFNEATVLQRSLILGNSRSDHVTEVLSPRIFRLGLRVHWR